MQALKVGIFGLSGRMGMMIHDALSKRNDMMCIAGTARRDIEGLKHLVKEGPKVAEFSDTLIDFTCPPALATHLDLATRHKKPLVIGTTGLGSAENALIQKAARDIPIVCAPNMSIGITFLLHLVELAAQKFDQHYDIEVHETHHRHKKDAPSGTALLLGRAAAKGRHVDFDKVAQLNWAGSGPREPGQIGFSVERGGEVIGDHRVSFMGQSEIISFTHHAQDRKIFAEGSLQAARWLRDKRPGLYSMRDVLGL